MRNIWIATECIILLISLFMASVLAAMAPATGSCRSTFQQMERDVPSLYLLNGLFLSQDQYKELSAVLTKAKKNADNHMRDLTKLSSDSSDLRSALKRDQFMLSKKMKTNRKPPRTASEHNFRKARKRFTQLNTEYNDRIRDLAHDVEELLTPAQQETIESFEPCFIPAEDFKNPVRVGQAQNDTQFGENILTRLRTVPDARLARATDRAVERITDYVMHKSRITYSETARENKRRETKERLQAVLPQVRAMNEVDFELKKANLVNQVIIVSKWAAPNPDDPTGTLTKISSYLLNPGLLDIVKARSQNSVATLSPQTTYTTYENKDVLKQYNDDRQTTRILALLNLTRKQATDLLPILEKGIKARQRVEYQIEEQMCEAIPAYRELRNDLAKGVPSQETEKSANHFHHQVKVLREENLVAAITAYEKELDALLTAEQVEALTAGRTPGAHNPQKTVEEFNTERKEAYKLMDIIRRMSTTEFNNSKSDMTIDYLEQCLQSDQEEEDIDIITESDRITELLAEIRTLDRPEFSRQKDDLATELCPRRASARSTKYGHKYQQGQPLQELDRSSTLLFTPTAHMLVQELAR